MDATSLDDESVVGEECHIISGKPGGPRSEPSFPDSEIDGYPNLLLLCRVHHKLVDDQAETYTAELLRQLKQNHETWVSESLDLAESGSEIGGMGGWEKRFRRVNASMPELIAEMRADLTGEGGEFVREFLVASKRWVLNTGLCFVYKFEDHDNLEGKIHVLENLGFIMRN